MAHILCDEQPVGWQCPSCRRCYAPSVEMCGTCQPGPAAGTSAGAVAYIASGDLATPCPKPREGGLCGCDEDDFEPRDCYHGRCGC